MDKRAFSFVEIIISISILVVLTIVATTATNNIKNNSNNSRVISDITTLKNGLISYTNEWNIVPKPDWNNNFYKADGSYVHEYSDPETFWAYWKITENTLDNRYLNITPLDPRTNQYYSYWVAKGPNQFEIAWVLFNEEWHRAKVEWNYTWEDGIYNLISEYNWNNFVIDKWPFLPYNPEEKLLTARDVEWNIYRQWDSIENNSWNDLEIFFSDWSSSIISNGSSITLSEMSFPNETNLVSKIKIFLDAWSIWTQATSLGEESSFDIFTSDTVASVRWTIFWVDKKSWETQVIVEQWTVDVYKIPQDIDRENVIQPAIIDEIEIIKTSPDYQKETIDIIKWSQGKKFKNIQGSVPEFVTDIIWIGKPFFSSKSSVSNVNYVNMNKKDVKAIKWESCYLEWVEVKDWNTREAFLNKVSTNCYDSSQKAIRTCNNWILEGNNDYKYSSCRTDLSCLNYYSSTKSWYIFDVWWLELTEWESTKINSISYQIPNWYLNHVWEITCQSNNQYTFSYKEHTVSCDIWYKSEENQLTWIKECVIDCNWTIINWECVNNNLGGKWKIYSNSAYNNPWDIYMYNTNWSMLTNQSNDIKRNCWPRRWVDEITLRSHKLAVGQCSLLNNNKWLWNILSWISMPSYDIPDWGSYDLWNGFSTNIDSSFIESNDWRKKWIYIESDNPDPTIWNVNDYLTYIWLFNDDEFAIEISVRWKELKRNDSVDRYLFDTWWVGLMHNNKDFTIVDKTDWPTKLISVPTSASPLITSFDSIINDDDYYKVILIVDYKELEFILKKDDWTTIWQFNKSTIGVWEDLNDNYDIDNIYIWSSLYRNKQWDWLIEYVTIYEEI